MRAAYLALGGVLLSLLVPAGGAATAATLPGAAATTTSVVQNAGYTVARKGQGKDYWTPKAGVTFNEPASPRGAYAILGKLRRSIDATAKGEKIRIAVWNFDDRGTVDALVRAKERGATIQVVVAGSVDNVNYTRLAGRLNRNKKDDSFAVQCRGGCRSRSKIMHSKFYLFSRIHKATDVSMFGSANMTAAAANRQWNDLVVSHNPKLFRFLADTFDQYKKDKSLKEPFENYYAGRYRATLYPARGRNPQLAALRQVTCRGTTGGTGTADHRTKLRLAVAGWFDSYGAEIATKLRKLWDHGCDVKVITTLAGRGVNRILRDPSGRGPIPIRRMTVDVNYDGIPERYLHMKSLTVSGVYKGDTGSSVVFTGSPNWSTRAQRSEELWMRITDAPKMTRQYADHIDALYNSQGASSKLMTRGDLRRSLVTGPNGRRTTSLPSWFEMD